MAQNIPFLMIGGDLHPVDENEDMFILKEQRAIARATEYECIIQVYVQQDDAVWTYTLRGVTGSLEIKDPSGKDRQFISASTVARMLVDEGIDVADFLQVVKGALWAMAYEGAEKNPLYAKLHNIERKLEGAPKDEQPS